MTTKTLATTKQLSKIVNRYKSIRPRSLVLISKGYDSLAISVDTDDYNFDNIKKWIAVLLVGDSENHIHVALSQKKARQLRDWLNKFLEQTGGK